MEQNGPLSIGMSSVDEYIENKFLYDTFISNCSLTTTRKQFVHNSMDQFQEWATKKFKEYRIFSGSPWSMYIYIGKSMVNIYMSSTMANVKILGVDGETDGIYEQFLDSPFMEAKSTIDWVHDPDGNSVSIPLFDREIIPNAYPWIKEGVDQFIDNYLNAPESVIILIGPPGTGKTSLIRYMINRSGGSATVAYDERVMGTDSLFANWLESRDTFLCLEDSDAFLNSRNDGNKMMHKFLNVSEGLVSVRGKKMVFSTNLPNINDIDEALLRPGRCYRVLQFRELTSGESEVIVRDLDLTKKIEDGKSYPLSKLFVEEAPEQEQSRAKKSFGFAP